MITEEQQEQATLCALGLLSAQEQEQFAAELQNNSELRELLHSLQQTVDNVALASPKLAPPAELKSKVLQRVRAAGSGLADKSGSKSAELPAGLQFTMAADNSGWKP